MTQFPPATAPRIAGSLSVRFGVLSGSSHDFCLLCDDLAKTNSVQGICRALIPFSKLASQLRVQHEGSDAATSSSSNADDDS